MAVTPQGTECSNVAVGATCAFRPILLCPAGTGQGPSTVPTIPPDPGRGPPAPPVPSAMSAATALVPAFLPASHHAAVPSQPCSGAVRWAQKDSCSVHVPGP